MSRMLGVFGHEVSPAEKAALLESLNPRATLSVECVDLNDGFVAAASQPASPLKGPRIFEEGDDIFAISGDLVGVGTVPWLDIAKSIRSGTHRRFAEYEGNFAISRYSRTQNRLTLISDRRSQKPLFFRASATSFFFSTEASSIWRLQSPPGFNERWLYDYLFFNYPLFGESFAKGLTRMPPASVLLCDRLRGEHSLSPYAEPFRAREHLVGRPDSFEWASTVFGGRVPRYYEGSDEVACAVTGGWDGKTMVSFRPRQSNTTAYTYGVAGCEDLKGGAATARRLKLRHKPIVFGDEFVRKLPEYMRETIFLSSGAEKVLRSTMLFMYEQLTENGTRFPLVVSGIGLDGVFRGSANVPAMVSQDLGRIFRTGLPEWDADFWARMFGAAYGPFKTHVDDRLAALKDTYGHFKSPEHHLLFKLYATHPGVFGGELSIAENFTTVRVPTWDREILELALSIRESALSYSVFTQDRKPDRTEFLLQAHLLKEYNPAIASVRIGGTSPNRVAGNRFSYESYRAYRWALRRSQRFHAKQEPLEDWQKWLNVCHRDFVDDLIFSADSLVRGYLSTEFLSALRKDRAIHWIGKVLTVELVLRFIRAGWTNSL